MLLYSSTRPLSTVPVFTKWHSLKNIIIKKQTKVTILLMMFLNNAHQHRLLNFLRLGHQSSQQLKSFTVLFNAPQIPYCSYQKHVPAASTIFKIGNLSKLPFFHIRSEVLTSRCYGKTRGKKIDFIKMTEIVLPR